MAQESLRDKPLISVITIAYNAQCTIIDALVSVRNQSYSNLEHILVDGASQDDTLALANEHRWKKLRIVSEPDEGIADAMNKGIGLAQGEWLLFLNADDYLCHPNILARVTPLLDDSNDIVGFPVLFGSHTSDLRLKRPRGANWYLNFKTGLMHQGSFIRKTLFDSIGYYDTNFQVTMDYEFFLRAYKKGARFSTHKSPPVAVMGDTGISSQTDWENLSQRFTEERMSQVKNSTGVIRWTQSLYWMLYPHYRFLRLALHR